MMKFKWIIRRERQDRNIWNRYSKPIKRSAYAQYLWNKGAGWNE